MYISYRECLKFYVEHTKIYMNVVKNSVKVLIKEIQIIEGLLY